jgi:hypothetical protein
LGKIAGIEPIRDVGFIEGRRLDKSKTVTVFIDIRLAAENMGRSVAFNATVSARLLLWGNSIAEELTQALACSGTIDNVGGDWPPIVVGPTIYSIFPSETRQLDIFWHGEVDAKYKGTSIDPRLVGCVIYSMPNSEKLHHSGFVYTIQYRPADRSLLWNRRAMKVGENVKREDLFTWPVPGTALVGYSPFKAD